MTFVHLRPENLSSETLKANLSLAVVSLLNKYVPPCSQSMNFFADASSFRGFFWLY